MAIETQVALSLRDKNMKRFLMNVVSTYKHLSGKEVRSHLLLLFLVLLNISNCAVMTVFPRFTHYPTFILFAHAVCVLTVIYISFTDFRRKSKRYIDVMNEELKQLCLTLLARADGVVELRSTFVGEKDSAGLT